MENTEKKSLFKNWLIKRLLSSETTREEALNYIASNNENTDIIHLTSLSIKKSAGKNIGNITADMNNTVIKGTPRQNSIKPIEIYLIRGNPDLLPRAKAIPIGKQKIKQKKEIMKVSDNPPHAPVSTQFNPSNFPNSINSS